MTFIIQERNNAYEGRGIGEDRDEVEKEEGGVASPGNKIDVEEKEDKAKKEDEDKDEMVDLNANNIKKENLY